MLQYVSPIESIVVHHMLYHLASDYITAYHSYQLSATSVAWLLLLTLQEGSKLENTPKPAAAKCYSQTYCGPYLPFSVSLGF